MSVGFSGRVEYARNNGGLTVTIPEIANSNVTASGTRGPEPDGAGGIVAHPTRAPRANTSERDPISSNR